MTFPIGSNEGGHAIPPGTEPLLPTFFSPSGITYTYLPGESETLYTLDLAGKPLLAEVPNTTAQWNLPGTSRYRRDDGRRCPRGTAEHGVCCSVIAGDERGFAGGWS